MFSDLSMSRSLQVDDIISLKLMNNEDVNNDCISLKVIRGLTDDTEQMS